MTNLMFNLLSSDRMSHLTRVKSSTSASIQLQVEVQLLKPAVVGVSMASNLSVCCQSSRCTDTIFAEQTRVWMPNLVDETLVQNRYVI